jgi:hypothetical protein
VLTDPNTGISFPGLFPEQAQVSNALSFLKAQTTGPAFPLSDRLDTSKLLLLGHSFGGAVGIAALIGDCVPFLCTGSYERPPELLGGAFCGSKSNKTLR